MGPGDVDVELKPTAVERARTSLMELDDAHSSQSPFLLRESFRHKQSMLGLKP